MASITVSNVWKIYHEGKGDKEVQAVKDVSLDIQDGEFLCLLGPSGCGKTSTLRMIAGLEEITRGNIQIGGRVVNTLHPSQRDIAMVFETYALYEHLTVYDNIAFPLRVRELSKEEIGQRVNRVVDILNLEDIIDRMPAQISDGQKQRVSIGRAIVRQPSAFLMDEPISHLDAMLRSRMRREITHLQRKLGITTVYVTHDQLEATAMADRIAVMNLGELQQLATPMEIFENPVTKFVAEFVGEPPMNFVDVEIKDSSNGIELKGDDFKITIHEKSHTEELKKLDCSEVTLGIRPMHVQTHLVKVEGAIPGQVYVVEPLDEFNIITVTFGDSRFLVESEPDFRPEIDQTIWLTIPEEKIHLFHPETGRSLLHKKAE
ncbi:MAG: ABC transporter ATP-binding protein [Anaerolineaceae bacterium]|nr:ABC transporter ATP-binding protein [Anaerolineaceae bacterium]